MKDLRIVAKIYNNQLRERREALGLTGTALAEKIGVPFGTYCHLETMHDSPLTSAVGSFGKPREPRWRDAAVKLAEFYRVTPEELFPEAVREMKRTIAEIRVNAEEVAALVAPPPERNPFLLLSAGEEMAALDEALAELSAREKDVLRLRFEQGLTRVEVGERFDLTHSRIAQIEQKALRKLRGNRQLRAVVES